MKTISIIGGGLAGLALGIGLRHQGVPVTLYEAGRYPRHRVCGEFVCGIRAETLNNLGILNHFVDAEQCNTTAWYHQGKPIYQHNLPVAAFGISRYLLDFRLARSFKKLGGRLFDDTRYLKAEAMAGRVWSAGRLVEAKSPWLGLKLHCKALPLTHDLEIHFGEHCYVGLSRIEDNMTNICGLFRKRPGITAKKQGVPFAYLKACGLKQLSDRILNGQPDPASILGIANINFKNHQPHQDRMAIGDHYTMIPPFTGNGMTMAFESAEVALEPIVFYAKGAISWEEALSAVKKGLRKRFSNRLRGARLMHPMLYSPKGQVVISKIAQTGLLPFNLLFKSTH